MAEITLERLKAMVESLDTHLCQISSTYTVSHGGRPIATESDLMDRIKAIFEFTKKLSLVYNESPHSIFVVDHNETAIMINKAFEITTGVKPETLIGRSVVDLEQAAVFFPSVLHLALSEKHPVCIRQMAENGKESFAKGVPVLDENGDVVIGVSNTLLVEEIQQLYRYMHAGDDPASFDTEMLVSSSPPIQSAMELIDHVKDTDATILIGGESGVGKGAFSRYIHGTSNRRNAPMVEINCGAIPQHLFESELFGYESGAFTGASQRGKPGLIETADGGTLLLDEISEMPLMLQVKLLKVIQDKKLTRIGGKTPIDVNVRIIAASNKDLYQMVQKGSFRADLYYRLNVIPIQLPPLREQKDDIPRAVEFFIDKSCRKYNKNIVCSKEFCDLLATYDWPGNIRELENYIERKVLTNRNGVLLEQDAADIVVSEAHPVQQTTMQPGDDHVLRLYNEHRSSYKVAEILGVSQSSAYRMIKKAVQSKKQ